MLGFIELFKEMRRCRVMRKRWKIEWCINGPVVDKKHFLLFLIPTIRYIPWSRRDDGNYIFIISWLNVHFGICKWNRRPKEDFKNV